MQNLPTPLIAVAIFVLLFVVERFFPLRKATRSLLARLFVNLAISVLAFIAAVGLLQPAVQSALRWSAGKPFGFVHLVALPSPFAFVLSFLLMDLTFYYWHLANHRWPFLWRFHNVHHIDPDFWNSLLMPFRKQRDYWRRPDGALASGASKFARGAESRAARGVSLRSLSA